MKRTSFYAEIKRCVMLQIMSTISLMIYFCVSAEDSKALTISIYGIIDGVKVPFPITEKDACKSSIKCPISKGMATTFAMSLFIEPSYPKVIYIYI